MKETVIGFLLGSILVALLLGSGIGNLNIAPGHIAMIVSGACPVGFSEVVAMNGKTVIGTLAVNGDVGTTGGSDSIVPAGTVGAITATETAALNTISLIGQATASNAHTHPAPTFTGSSLDNRSAFVRVIFCSKN